MPAILKQTEKIIIDGDIDLKFESNFNVNQLNEEKGVPYRDTLFLWISKTILEFLQE